MRLIAIALLSAPFLLWILAHLIGWLTPPGDAP
jgi:hypothetical protein